MSPFLKESPRAGTTEYVLKGNVTYYFHISPKSYKSHPFYKSHQFKILLPCWRELVARAYYNKSVSLFLKESPRAGTPLLARACSSCLLFKSMIAPHTLANFQSLPKLITLIIPAGASLYATHFGKLSEFAKVNYSDNPCWRELVARAPKSYLSHQFKIQNSKFRMIINRPHETKLFRTASFMILNNYALRCRLASNISTAAATDTFIESITPSIGIMIF